MIEDPLSGSAWQWVHQAKTSAPTKLNYTEREERSLTPCAHCFQLCCSPNLRLISTGLGLARWSCCKLYFSFRIHSPGHSVCLASNGKAHAFFASDMCVCVRYSMNACMSLYTLSSQHLIPLFWCTRFYKAKSRLCVICTLRSMNPLCSYTIKNERTV